MNAVLLLALLACGDKDDPGTTILDSDGGAADDTGDTGPTVDTECPTIDHEPVPDGQLYDEPVDIAATITDTSGVFQVVVYYKQETSTNWTSLQISPVTPGGSEYAGQIPGSAVGSGGMDYYIKASDQLNNECTLPEDGEDDPYHFRVSGD